MDSSGCFKKIVYQQLSGESVNPRAPRGVFLVTETLLTIR
ncbi:protein of unknown function [Candidatus Nitrospira inopinata]|uniref:Uncharacterized protein n=1 Tax=Candidatus Nitrospira inopinata TaxID=1715989 RepID=A0A0S4KLS5_9BACT|nr:protein of unknown function [Candidatus Nitrospira inopinata]